MDSDPLLKKHWDLHQETPQEAGTLSGSGKLALDQTKQLVLQKSLGFFRDLELKLPNKNAKEIWSHLHKRFPKANLSSDIFAKKRPGIKAFLIKKQLSLKLSESY